MKNNPTPLTKDKIEHQFGKKKVVLTFYTGFKGQEIVLESKLIGRIEQTDDVDELTIHVKMPSKYTKEFRNAIDQAILQERNRIVEMIDFDMEDVCLKTGCVNNEQDLLEALSNPTTLDTVNEGTK